MQASKAGNCCPKPCSKSAIRPTPRSSRKPAKCSRNSGPRKGKTGANPDPPDAVSQPVSVGYFGARWTADSAFAAGRGVLVSDAAAPELLPDGLPRQPRTATPARRGKGAG